MTIEFKYVATIAEEGPIRALCAKFNNRALPAGVVDKIYEEFVRINGEIISAGMEIYVPILPPFFKKHTNLLDTVEPRQVEPEPEPIVEVAEEPEPIKEKPRGTVHHRTYPYTFSRPGETIEAVIRLYNDMSVDRSVIDKLVHEFSDINQDSLPPKLGQTVQVPVLLPFCFRHENEHKIFTDE